MLPARFVALKLRILSTVLSIVSTSFKSVPVEGNDFGNGVEIHIMEPCLKKYELSFWSTERARASVWTIRLCAVHAHVY